MSRVLSVKRTALVTGALGGLGRAIVKRLAEDGYRLVITDMQSCSDFIREEGLEGQVVHHAICNLESESDVDAFMEQVLEKTSVDVLVNNAAHMALIPFDQLTHKDVQRFMRVNIEAAIQMIKIVSDGMSKSRWGRIINLVSGSAWQPPRGFVGYISSKMGMVGMTRALAVELGEDGICVNALTPSLTRHAGNENTFPVEFWDMIKARQAIKRTAVPEDIVGVISFLASDDSAFMTGQTLSVDGGSVFL